MAHVPLMFLQRRVRKSKTSSTSLQTKMHRSATAYDLIGHIMQERRVDFLLLSEQYQDRSSPSLYDETNTINL